MSDLKQQFDTEVANFEKDYASFTEKGNAAAGTRARKALQNIKNIGGALRKEIQEAKNSK